MNRLALAVVLLATLAALMLVNATVAAAARGDDTAVRRFALVAGSNDGGPSRVALHYAVSDAQAFASVLSELGGVAPEDLVILSEANRESLLGGLAAMRQRLAAAAGDGHRRLELLVYYSGHSDETGLLPAGQRVGYDELRRALADTHADVRIGVVDSCASGELVRGKGGVRRPAFLTDASAAMSGHAFLTSSSADESAQESDRLSASFFTHALVTGLRGAADSNHDGRVTLDEAYRFAFAETLERTEKTSHGPQHPAYDIQLAGSGELVITDLHAAAAALVFAAELGGRLFVRDDTGRLVAELGKPAGQPLELGLPAGTYRLTLVASGGVFEGRAIVATEGKTAVSWAALAPAGIEIARARGDVDGPERYPVRLGLIDPMTLGPPDATVALAFHLGWGNAGAVHGVSLGLFGAGVTRELEGAQMAGFGTVVKGSAKGAQLSGFFTWAGTIEGVQVSGMLAASHRLEGLQLATANYAEEMHGAQIGVANLAGSVDGTQIGVVSVGRQIDGMQFAVVNVGGDVTAGQIGVVNVAHHVHGMQLGVVNIADDVDGAPIGLVSWVTSGMHHVEVWSTEASALNVGVLLGGHRVYTMWGFGTDPGSGDPKHGDHFALTGALGVRFPVEGTRLHLDLVGSSTSFFESADFGNIDVMLSTLRLSVGAQVAQNFGVFAGLTANLMVGWHDDNLSPRFDYGLGGTDKTDDRTVRWYPGLILGVEI